MVATVGSHYSLLKYSLPHYRLSRHNIMSFGGPEWCFFLPLRGVRLTVSSVYAKLTSRWLRLYI